MTFGLGPLCSSTNTVLWLTSLFRAAADFLADPFSSFAFSGRDATDLVRWELNESELEEITRLGPYHSDSSLPAFYHLYIFEVS